MKNGVTKADLTKNLALKAQIAPLGSPWWVSGFRIKRFQESLGQEQDLETLLIPAQTMPCLFSSISMAPHHLHREAQVSQPVLDVMVCQVSFSSADPFLSTSVAKPVFCEYFILHSLPSPGCPSFYCFRLGQNLCFRSSSLPWSPRLEPQHVPCFVLNLAQSCCLICRLGAC